MRIIISPAKKMNIQEDYLDPASRPCLLEKTEKLLRCLSSLDYDTLKRIWKCNDAIASLNFKRLSGMDLYSRLTPAILAYEGIQYQYMAPRVFDHSQWDYVRHHLYILSGFYGLLNALDGVSPYRLEMQARLPLDGPEKPYTTLYRFWGDSICRELAKETKVIVNLASSEYSKAVEPYIPREVRLVTCVFGTLSADRSSRPRVEVKATQAKMARGEMVRHMARRQIKDVEELKNFDGLGYRYSEEWSDPGRLVFLRGAG